VLPNWNVQFSFSKIPSLSNVTNIPALGQSLSTPATLHPTTSVTSGNAPPLGFAPSLFEHHEDAGGDGFNPPSISVIPYGSDENEQFLFTAVFQISNFIFSHWRFLVIYHAPVPFTAWQ
jgi:hypothetical protein